MNDAFGIKIETIPEISRIIPRTSKKIPGIPPKFPRNLQPKVPQNVF